MKSALEEKYNIQCCGCGQIWCPAVRSPLWWKAKSWANRGKIDALHVSAEDCGCVEKKREPDAPYRVFGFDDEFHEFDIPFTSFVGAVKKYRDASQSMCTVFISGVSPAVEAQLTGF